MNTTYSSPGFKRIRTSQGLTHAARVYATRHARRRYGGRGKAVYVDWQAESGPVHQYEARVGVQKWDGFKGHNIRFTVTIES